jgi:hypothetical protein
MAAPNIKGHLMSDEEHQFSYTAALYPQEAFYYMAVGPAQSGRGKVIVRDRFMRAPDRDFFFNPIGNIIGFFSKLFQITIPQAFLLFRMLAAVVLLLAFYFFSGLFFQSIALRIMSTALYIFGSGLGVQNIGIHIDGVDASIPEMNMFISIIGEYYIPLANALFLLAFWSFYRLLQGFNDKPIILGFLLCSLGAIYIYGLLIAFYLMASVIAWLFFKERALPILLIKKIAVASIFALPIISYYAWLYLIFNNAAKEDGWFPGPDIFSAIAAYGHAFLPSVVGFLIFRKKWLSIEGIPILIIWVIAILAITRINPPYFPFQVQAYIGLGAPLSILAVRFYHDIVYCLKLHSRKMLLAICGVLIEVIAAGTNSAFYFDYLKMLDRRTYPVFIPRNEYVAAEWINEQINMDARFIVEASRARVLAGLTGVNVFFNVYEGNGPEAIPIQAFIEEWSTDIDVVSAEDLTKQMKEFGATHLFIESEFQAKFLNQEKLQKLLSTFNVLYAENDVYVLAVNN